MYSNIQLTNLGKEFGEYTLRQPKNRLASAAFQALIADLASDIPDLQAALRDVVSRQSFMTLLPYARSGNGSIQRDAFIREIERVYHSDILEQIEEVLNGFLGLSGSTFSLNTQNKTRSMKSQIPSKSNVKIEHNSIEPISSNTARSSISNQTTSPVIASYAVGVTVTALIISAFFVNVFINAHRRNGHQNPEVSTIQGMHSSKDSQLNELADEIFWRRHPSLKGKKLTQQDGDLAREWMQIRDCEAIVDYKFYEIYPYMKGRLIQENQIEMVSTWQNLHDQTPGCP